MERKKFLLTTAAAIPAIVFGKQFSSHKKNQPKRSFVVKANESRFGEKTFIGGKSPNDLKVSLKDTDGQLSIFEYQGNEKGGPPLHLHPYQDEIFIVTQGNYLFQVGEEKFNLTAGDTIFLPRNVPHTFAQISDKGKMIFLFQPSGKMEEFFRSVGNLIAAPSPEEGAKLFAAHDMTVVGPPLSF